ncbi:hypothetical protein VPH35_039698 [Triticum aestivum]
MSQVSLGAKCRKQVKEIQSGYKIFLCYPMYDASGEMGGNSLACQHERHRPYTLKDTFVRLDLTLSDATLPPLLLEISRRVSLLPLCFNGCFNALRLSIMSSWWCLDETIDRKMGSVVLVVLCPPTNCKTPKMILQDLIHSNYSFGSSSYSYTWFCLVILRSIL